MRSLATPLIKSHNPRQLSALGCKQLYRIIRKACEVNGTHHYSRESDAIKAQVITLVNSLIFDHGITKEQLSTLQCQIKVVNGQLQIPTSTPIQI